MTNKFTTPCFVRVENAEEREQLCKWCKSLGYCCPDIPNEERLGELVICDKECVGIVHNPVTFSIETAYIDCGDNIELFKALAAMNDENDREQWFTDGYHWHKCMRKRATQRDNAIWVSSYLHVPYKATAEELINHFKSK